MIDATYSKVHRTASSLRMKREGRGRLIGRIQGRLNAKLLAVTDATDRSIRFFKTAGEFSDYIGAAATLSSLPTG